MFFHLRVSFSAQPTCMDVDKFFNLRNEFIHATLAPDFWTSCQLRATIPGDSLFVEVYDHDSVSSDELIGVTRVDLENRIFCQEWQAMGTKPLEQRTLWVDNSSFPQVIYFLLSILMVLLDPSC